MMRPADELVQIYLYREFVDMRKSIPGLTLIVETELGADPFQGLYVFTNKRRTLIKLLYWERNGFCLWLKRLEKERFKWPKLLEEPSVELTGMELNYLLDGFDLWSSQPHKTLHLSTIMT